jgi:NAD(P)-dependent dehydrogenase (short-subunit alcohol dehydrogenase family)
LAARRQESLEQVRSNIETQSHTAVAFVMDVTDSASVGSALAKVVDRLGKLDIHVNNAGTTLTKPFLDLAEDDWDRIIETNLNGAFLAAQAAARIMKTQESGGAIVNIASILGLRGQVAPYVASKAAIVHLTKAMALELARHRIHVNALCPGYIETEGKLEDLEGPLLLMCRRGILYDRCNRDSRRRASGFEPLTD